MKKYLLLTIFISLIAFYFISKHAQKDEEGRDNSFESEVKEEKESKLYPSEWEWIKRTFPYYNADPRAYREAINKAYHLSKETEAFYLGKSKAVPAWEFAGPVNVGGRVVDIEFNPKDASIVYAASATGGVLKSTDKGVNWVPIFDDQAVLTIGDIGIDPKNPEIIYVGTGEANGGHNNFPGGGIYKSTNAGLSWQFMGLDSTASIGRVLVDPKNTDNVYVAAVGSYFAPNSQRGVYKSTDAGKSWQKALSVSDSTGAIDIVMDTSNPSFLMAAMWERVRRPNTSHLYGPSGGIYRSEDAGKTWIKLGAANGLPNPETRHVGRIGLAMSPSQPSITYALYNDGSQVFGLYKTTDYGNNWVKLDAGNQISSGVSNFSWYFGQVRVHPKNPDIVFVMDVSLMRSSDGGATWPLNYGYGGPSQLHVDHHALAFSPDNPDYIVEGNDGGINISNNLGISWSTRADLPVTQFYEINFDYKNPLALYGGTQDNNTIRTLSGKQNDWFSIYGNDGFYCAVDFTNSNVVYAESQFGELGKSTDGGRSFGNAITGINTKEPTNWSTPVVMDPNNNNILYYGTNRIYRTINQAASWTAISGNLTNGNDSSSFGTITTIAVAPSNSKVIYAGTDDGNVNVTTDNGTSWKKITKGLPYRWVTRVVADPKKENVVYVTFSGLKWRDPQPHVFRSTDYGQNWNDISGNLPDAPVDAFAVDLNDQNILYAGTDVGAFVSYNLGISWQTLGKGLPVVPVNDMKIHPVSNYLIAGTHGRSMYKINLAAVTGINDQDSRVVIKNYSLEQNYPNPFNPVTKIKYSIPQYSSVLLKIFDLQGREVKTLVNEYKASGTYETEFNASGLPSGVYLYRLQAGSFSDTKKLILVK